MVRALSGSRAVSWMLGALVCVGCGGSSTRHGITDDARGGGGTSTGGSAGTSSPTGGSAGTPSCEPQDAEFIGWCQPAPKDVFTGVECIGMSGCSCIGDDCDDLVVAPPVDPSNPLPNPCESKFGGCFGVSRTCEEIAAVYFEYTSHDACEHDDECQVNPGGCAIGLGGCYHVMNLRWPVSGLEALWDAWRRAGCMASVCRCAAPPPRAVCVDGVCTGVP